MKINLSDVPKNILLLLDTLAIFQFLFHHCNPSIKRATIFRVYLDLLMLKNTIHIGSLRYFTDITASYFYMYHENFK